MSQEKKNWRVGDRLAFYVDGINEYWEICKISRISPSGRITCGHFVLNPDLTVRGRSDFGTPFRAQPVTDDIRVAYARQRNLLIIRSKDFSELTNEVLVQIVRLITENPSLDES